MTPLFSILHTSARPGAWRAVYDDWMAKARFPEKVEYVLCIDPRWGFSLDPAEYDTPLDNLRVVQNTMRRCYVDGVNLAAQASTGSILVVNADDQFPCENWGERILECLQSEDDLNDHGASVWVLEVSTGTDDPRGIPEHDRGIMVAPILSRERYEQQGFVFYPEYESMCADNDFCECARKDGVVIDGRHLMFPHRHWINRGREYDAADVAQNRPEAHKLGLSILSRRRASGFPPLQHGRVQRSIAVCLSGDKFEGDWLDGWDTLHAHLLLKTGLEVIRLRSYTSNVHITRDDTQRALAAMVRPPDLVLHLDDDNILSPDKFDMLLADLDAHPEADGIAAWCWIHNRLKQGFMPSCGEWSPDCLHWSPFPSSFQHEQKLRRFDVGGLPCLLHRYSVFEKTGPGAFLPIIDARLEHGMSGEDIGFFKHAGDAGCTFLVDPRARIPHLKYVEVEPVFPAEGKVPVRVACMIRAKNEARWIGHCIESIKELCGDLIFVMEDGSSDNTAQIVLDSGAVLLPSPFAGMGLDEPRDKDWLLHEVIERCHPDWIIMPDGDEELQPGGCAKIRGVLETNPAVDCFALRFLYFWDSIDTVRFDGVYGTLGRQSLFRANEDFRFKSYYDGVGENKNHCGLHCSNAPGLGGRVAPLNVYLYHYGYLHREDRIAKYNWIRTIDPDNAQEDNYRHCVQGDLPEFPADAKFLHAGPLVVQKIPRWMLPKFDKVPGPRGETLKLDVWATPENAAEYQRSGD